MPNIKAAIKWARRSERKRTQNLDVKTRLKTLYKKGAASSDDQTARSVESEFDRAAKKGIIHPNKAARKKSRLAKARAKTAAAPAASAEKKKPSSRGRKTSAKTKSR